MASTRTRVLEEARSLTMVGVPLEKGPSTIKIKVLEKWLSTYPRNEDAKYLLDGFRYGFRILAEGESKVFIARNLPSIMGMEDIVQNKINKEVKEGRVLGSFSTPPIRNLRVSPLGIVPKKGPG